jgi:ketosteroid isomerase-like protein
VGCGCAWHDGVDAGVATASEGVHGSSSAAAMVAAEAELKNWANVSAVFRDADYEVRGLDVTVGDDVAFGHCFGRLHGTLMNGTATMGIWVRVTFCLRKLDGAWQIVHDQASVPFDVLSGRGVADLEP